MLSLELTPHTVPSLATETCLSFPATCTQPLPERR